jgi:sporulation protein YlmC with PRC-barrel domain
MLQRLIVTSNEGHPMVCCDLLEDTVVDAHGSAIGTIEELMIDVRAGAVAYAVVAAAGERMQIPWRAMRFDAAGRRFVLEKSGVPSA